MRRGTLAWAIIAAGALLPPDASWAQDEAPLELHDAQRDFKLTVDPDGWDACVLIPKSGFNAEACEDVDPEITSRFDVKGHRLMVFSLLRRDEENVMLMVLEAPNIANMSARSVDQYIQGYAQSVGKSAAAPPVVAKAKDGHLFEKVTVSGVPAARWRLTIAATPPIEEVCYLIPSNGALQLVAFHAFDAGSTTDLQALADEVIATAKLPKVEGHESFGEGSGGSAEAAELDDDYKRGYDLGQKLALPLTCFCCLVVSGGLAALIIFLVRRKKPAVAPGVPPGQGGYPPPPPPPPNT